MAKRALHEAFKTDFIFSKIKFFLANIYGQYLLVTNVTRSLHSLKIEIKLKKFKSVFLNMGSIRALL